METIFKVGDSVVVNKGVMDADFPDYCLEGLQGRITEITTDEEEEVLVCIAWDSQSLKSMQDYIPTCEEEGMDWTCCYLFASEVSIAKVRDTNEDTQRTIKELQHLSDWAAFGEQGNRIAAVLGDSDPDDEEEMSQRWEQYLKPKITLPFPALITNDHLGDRHLKPGDRVKIKAFRDIDEMLGVMVEVNAMNGHFLCPLCDLEAENSAEDQILEDYRIWYTNH